jgi:RNA polymerase sigma factor (sigma-70 family)
VDDEPNRSEDDARVGERIAAYGKYIRAAVARLCPRDLGIDVDDVEQEARLRIWKALTGERGVASLSSYIYRVAVTTTIDAIRSARARREEQLRVDVGAGGDEPGGLVLAQDPARSPEQEALLSELEEVVGDALAALAENRRRAVRLHIEGFTSREVADLLGWSEAKARNLIYRGLSDLRAELKARGIDYEADE